jgi:hypothetical protein
VFPHVERLAATEARGNPCEQLLRRHDADDVVARPFEDRISRMLTAFDHVDERLQRSARVQRSDLWPRNHHLMGRELREIESPIYNFLRGLLHQTGLAACGDRELQFLGRLDEGMAGGRLNAEQANDGIADGVKREDREADTARKR